jgi:hypothetical protein
MLLSKLKIAFVVITLAWLLPTVAFAKPSEQTHVLALCDQLYGTMIDRRMGLYAVNEFFVLKPVFDRRGNLVVLYVEPKWYYDWYNVAWEARDDFRNLSKSDFERLLADIDRVKPKGTLMKPASDAPEIRNSTAWRRATYTDAVLEWGEVADSQRAQTPATVRWFNVSYVKSRGAT